MKYFLNTPSLNNLEKKYILDVLKTNWLSSNGKHTREFEKKFVKFLGLKYGIAVQSGTSALHVALKAAGVETGDRIITPNYTCVSNLSCITQCNATPVIVEVERDTLGLDVDLVKKAIKMYKPKALQLVHVYGYPARDTIKIAKLCRKNKIVLIEDSSESFGSEIDKKKIGSFGDINVTSIRSEKMIGVGEGGILSFSKKNLYEKALLFASRHAPFRTRKDPYWKKYFVNGEGYNYLMPHLLGAVARAQIEKFSKSMLPKKIKIAQFYKKIFTDRRIELTQKRAKNHKVVYWLNSIYFKDLNKKQVNKIGAELMKHGVEVRSGFWPLNKQAGFDFKYIGNKKSKASSVSDDIFYKSLVLPSNIDLQFKDIKNIYTILIKILDRHEK